jgi:hypothetical protein
VTKNIATIAINLVTPKARAKHEPFVQQTSLRSPVGGFESNRAKKVETFRKFSFDYFLIGRSKISAGFFDPTLL